MNILGFLFVSTFLVCLNIPSIVGWAWRERGGEAPASETLEEATQGSVVKADMVFEEDREMNGLILKVGHPCSANLS